MNDSDQPSDNKFTWNDLVRIKTDAPVHLHPGELAVVCGMENIRSVQLAEEFCAEMGTWLYTVEFGNGSSIEIPERYLDMEMTS